MSKIRILPAHIANQIAAGEVIERPASVVKELVENSIDAGANRIRVEIESAGSRLIRVGDNGCGMDEDDLLLSIEPHGTSKIKEESDIHAIQTLGFRGEAIPSIASISKFCIQSRTAAKTEGAKLTVDGGRVKDLTPCGCPTGTLIEVKDLFYNIPARKKFLKAPATESHHIEECVIAMAIAHKDIGFELIADGRVVFNTPASPDLRHRLREFFGRNYSENLLGADHTQNGIHVHGFVAAPGFKRPSRKEQRVFVNLRPVEALAAYRGIKDGYGTIHDDNGYPPVCLFIELPFSDVDVNVHPAKREVRFKHEYQLSAAIAAAVGNALHGTPGELPGYLKNDIKPVFDRGTVPLHSILAGADVSYELKPEQDELNFAETEKSDELFDRPAVRPAAPPILQNLFRPAAPIAPAPAPAAADTVPREIKEVKLAAYDGNFPRELLGILNDSYLLAAGADGLVMIDQHAAHERIWFEKLLFHAQKGAPSQSLLLPETVELPVPQISLLLRQRPMLEEIGFDLEPLGSTTVMVNALPANLPSSHIAEIFAGMLHELLENEQNKFPVALEFVARAACKAAVKFHDKLTMEAAKALMAQLQCCRQPTLCPHGRPTMITVTYAEIEKRFQRK